MNNLLSSADNENSVIKTRMLTISINLLYQWSHLFYSHQCLGVQFLRASDSFGVGSGPIFLDRLNCGLNDTRVLDCVPRSRQGLPECNHDRDVGIYCEGVSVYVHESDVNYNISAWNTISRECSSKYEIFSCYCHCYPLCFALLISTKGLSTE